jgi:hypothetical protein
LTPRHYRHKQQNGNNLYESHGEMVGGIVGKRTYSSAMGLLTACEITYKANAM